MKRALLHGWFDVDEPRVTVWIFSEADDQRVVELLAQDFEVLYSCVLGGRQRIELVKSRPKVEEATTWPREGFRW